jgi:hypothetical protein
VSLWFPSLLSDEFSYNVRGLAAIGGAVGGFYFTGAITENWGQRYDLLTQLNQKRRDELLEYLAKILVSQDSVKLDELASIAHQQIDNLARDKSVWIDHGFYEYSVERCADLLLPHSASLEGHGAMSIGAMKLIILRVAQHCGERSAAFAEAHILKANHIQSKPWEELDETQSEMYRHLNPINREQMWESVLYFIRCRNR